MAIHGQFSISQGETRDLGFMIIDQAGLTITGSEIWFQVFNEQYGVPNYDMSPSPVILKSTEDGSIDQLESPGDTFVVHLMPSDTVDLLGNYYYECRIMDANQNVFIVSKGIMAVEPSFSFPV